MTISVAVNVLWCTPGEVGGSEEYLVRQLTGLGELDSDVAPTLCCTTAFADAHPDLATQFPMRSPGRLGGRRSARIVAEHTWLARKSSGFDVVHHAGGTIPLIGPRPILLTVHDLQYLELPQYFTRSRLTYLRLMMPRSVARAAVVATPSEFVRGTVIEAFGIDAARVVVVPHGVRSTPIEQSVRSTPIEQSVRSTPIEQSVRSTPIEQSVRSTPIEQSVRSTPIEQSVRSTPIEQSVRSTPIEQNVCSPGPVDACLVRKRYGLGEGPYVVYPAITHPHKNHQLLIDVMARHWTDPTLRLVLLGGAGAVDTAVGRSIIDQGLGNRVVRPGRVRDADRDALIAGATALVFPSRYEGFGAPLIEAMALGTPVVCGDHPALREVAGSAAIVLPDDADAWSGALDEVAHRRAELVAAGRERATHYTLATSGAALVDAYHRTLS